MFFFSFFFLRFTTTISYFGLCLSTPNMNGDPYLNCLFSALTEVAAYVLTWLLIKVVPRRALITGPLLSGGLVLLLIPAVPTGKSHSINPLSAFNSSYEKSSTCLPSINKINYTIVFFSMNSSQFRHWLELTHCIDDSIVMKLLLIRATGNMNRFLFLNPFPRASFYILM